MVYRITYFQNSASVFNSIRLSNDDVMDRPWNLDDYDKTSHCQVRIFRSVTMESLKNVCKLQFVDN